MADNTAVQLPEITVRPPLGNPTAGAQLLSPDALAKQYADVTGQYKSALSDYQKQATDPAALAKVQQSGQAAQDAIQKAQDSLKPPTEAKPDPESPDLKSKQMTLGTALGALMMGVIAGRAGKTGGWSTGAKALAETQKAFAANDKTRIDQNLAAYKVELGKIKDYNENLQSAWKDSLETSKTNVALAMEKNRLIAAQFAESLAPAMAKAASIQEQMKLLEPLVKMSEVKQDKMLKQQEFFERMRHNRAEEEKWRADSAAKGGAAGLLTPEALEDAAHTWMQTGTAPTGYGRSPGTLAKIANRKAEIEQEQGLTAEAAASRQVANKATQTALRDVEKREAAINVNASAAEKNFSTIERLSTKVDRTGSPILNRLRQNWDTNVIQDPDLAALKNAVKETATEYAKVVTGQTTGAAVTNAANAQAQTLLNSADSPQAFAKEIATMREFIGNRRQAVQSEKQSLLQSMKGSADSAPAKTVNWSDLP